MIQFFLSDMLSSLSQGHIFLSESISFTTLAREIHQKLQNQKSIDLYIYVNSEICISNLEILENFEILFDHSLIQNIIFVIDSQNLKFAEVNRAIRFMRDVYQYNVSTKIAEYQIISTSS